MMRSGLLLLMVAAMIAAGCRSVSYQTADSAAVEPAVFSSAEAALAKALAAFLHGRLIEGMDGAGIADAMPHYRYAAHYAQGSHAVHARIAAGALYRGNLSAALDALQASYTARPDDPERMIALATMYQLANQPAAATELYNQALAITPTNTTLALALGDLYFHQQDDERALTMFDTAFRQAAEPEAIEKYLYQRVQRFVISGELDRAIAALERIAEWSAEDKGEIGYMIGELHIARQSISDALQALYVAVALPGAPPAAFLRLGSLLLDAERPAEAIAVIQSGGDRFPDLASFPFALGGLLIEDRQYEEALLAYENAVRIATQTDDLSTADENKMQDRKNLLLGLATAQERLKRFDDAAATMQLLLAEYPDSHIAMNFLAYMWAEMDTNIEEAYALSKRSLEMDPRNGAYLDTLGWIYFRKGELDKALLHVAQAREQIGSDPEIILHFGDIYAAKGEQERAVQYWQESLMANPTKENRAWEQLVQAGIDPRNWLPSEDDNTSISSERPDNDTAGTAKTERAPQAQNHDDPRPEKGLDTEGDQP
ncbi:MAG: tetratricopeptide repeat protein [Kiritimatiellia bacterium]